MKKSYDNILDLIGHTPIVEIRNLNPNKKVRIYAKLEGSNPGGSIKDRTALYMIERAEERGLLTPGKTNSGSHKWKHRYRTRPGGGGKEI